MTVSLVFFLGFVCVNSLSLESLSIGTLPDVATTTNPAVTTTVKPVASPAKTPNNTRESEQPHLGETKEVANVEYFPYSWNKKVIGEHCKTTDDCKTKEAFCVNHTCQCSSEYVPSSNKKSCLFRAGKLLDDCAENVQCEVGMNATGLVACISFKCICALDAYVVGLKCFKKLALGNACTHDEECSIDFSSCIQNVCACEDNMEPSEDDSRCIVMKSINAAHTNCTDDYSCSRFGELYRCNEGICQCKPGYHFSGIQCVSEKKLGDRCERPSDCLVDFEITEKAVRDCISNECTCIDGYTTDKVHNICKSGASLISSSLLLIFISIFYATKNK